MRLFSGSTRLLLSRIQSLFGIPVILGMLLTGCASTGNIDPKYDLSAKRDAGIVLFSVTHDKYQGPFGSLGGGLVLDVHIRDAIKTTLLPSAFSSDPGSLRATTPFETVWGRYFVREYPAGRYEFTGWDFTEFNSFGSRTYKPKELPLPLAFDVRPGDVIYVGNVHGSLSLGNNLLGVPVVVDVDPLIRNEAERDLPLIQKEYPQLKGKVEIKPFPVGAWGHR